MNEEQTFLVSLMLFLPSAVVLVVKVVEVVVVVTVTVSSLVASLQSLSLQHDSVASGLVAFVVVVLFSSIDVIF